MSLRDKLVAKDHKFRPPAFIGKVCVHNGDAALDRRFRGDMGLDLEFDVGRQIETYTCIQCGYMVSAEVMMVLYQRYMLTGSPVVVGQNIKRL